MVRLSLLFKPLISDWQTATVPPPTPQPITGTLKMKRLCLLHPLLAYLSALRPVWPDWAISHKLANFWTLIGQFEESFVLLFWPKWGDLRIPIALSSTYIGQSCWRGQVSQDIRHLFGLSKKRLATFSPLAPGHTSLTGALPVKSFFTCPPPGGHFIFHLFARFLVAAGGGKRRLIPTPSP